MADYELDITEETTVRWEGSWGASEPQKATLRITAWASIDRQRGGFEIYDIETRGEAWYAEGGLWFNEDMELMDYDGVFSLDSRIRAWIEGGFE